MVGWDEEEPFCNTTRSIEWRNFIIIILEWTTRGTLLQAIGDGNGMSYEGLLEELSRYEVEYEAAA